MVFPEPLAPTTPILSPLLILKFKLSYIFVFSLEGYENVTFLNNISLQNLIVCVASSFFLNSRYSSFSEFINSATLSTALNDCCTFAKEELIADIEFITKNVSKTNVISSPDDNLFVTIRFNAKRITPPIHSNENIVITICNNNEVDFIFKI